MKRREFIAVLGGATWSLVARAQQAQRMRRIGVLLGQAADDPESMARNAAFLQGLQEMGWSVGRNVQIDYRWGAGDAGRIRKFATELVALKPDVIMAAGNPIVLALQQATDTLRPTKVLLRTDRIVSSQPMGDLYARACHDTR